MGFRSICTIFDLAVEGTHVRENSNKIWFSSYLIVPLHTKNKRLLEDGIKMWYCGTSQRG